MAKKSNKNQKLSFYDTLLKYRVAIMFSFLFVIVPLLIITVFTVTLISTNTYKPFDDEESSHYTENYTKSTIEEISETKFVIKDFYLSKFYVQTPYDADGNSEYVTDGAVEFRIDLGNTVNNTTISGNISINTYVCWDWSDIEPSQATSTLRLQSTYQQHSISKIDTTFNKKPNWFVSIDVFEDVRFISLLSWKETINGEDVEVKYLVEHSYDDLYRDGKDGNLGTSLLP